MADRSTLGVALATALVVLAALAPTFVAARPANQIPVETVSANANMTDPTADEWTQVPTATVPLASAPSTVPNANQTSVESVNVQAARSESRLYLQLSWADDSQNRNASDPRAFADAVAVQFPVNTSNRPAIAMGSPTNLVNVWYWSADGTGQELLAGGPGTTTDFAQPAVNASQTYRNGRWHVVLARDLQPGGENRTAIPDEQDVDVAFAVWNGQNMERSGQKAVSEWYTFPFGPGPAGPPFETLLWVVAGAAIVFVVGVTITAVRRT
ncbi:ethylbenzene dehydrogenase-related protein [Halobacteriaceae archaeon GCM10025711]